MKAAVVNTWGEAPVYLDQPEPEARDGAVVATVEATALTNLTRVWSPESTTPARRSNCLPSRVSTGWSASRTAAASTPAHSHPTG